MSSRYAPTNTPVVSEQGRWTIQEEATAGMGLNPRIRLSDNNSGMVMLIPLDDFFDLVNLADDVADEIEERNE